MNERRFFNDRERAALYLATDGHCTNCGTELEPGWHADHETPYSAGGETDVINGQALCPRCNIEKGSTLNTLRTWQQDALDVLSAGTKADYLITATPGAGKTTFALAAAKMMLHEGTISRIVVIVPTDSLRLQWADAAGRAGLQLMPVSSIEDYDKAGYVGCVATYAQLSVGAGRDLMRRTMRKSTLAILDEVHHAGDNRSWGDGLQHAVELASTRLALTGTPWRRDARSPIPFVQYDPDGKVIVDYAYEYGTAVADGVCRRIEFYAWDGEAKWIDHSKPPGSGNGWARLGVNIAEDDVSTVLDGVYDPAHQWMPVVLAEANKALDEMRQDIPDAAGLIVAERQWHALAYAKLLRDITGVDPVVVVSEDPDAKAAIDRFRVGRSQWLIAVKMVSEGVDIPRLAIGVYASKSKTPLFFRQVVGRFVRTRPAEDINARLFIPAVPALMDHAREIEDELRHQLDIEAKRADADQHSADGGQQELPLRTVVSAGGAEFDRAIVAGEEVSPADCAEAEATARRLGIPQQFALNLLPLIRGGHAPITPLPIAAEPSPITETPRHRQEKLLRKEVEQLARKYAYRGRLEPKQVNYELRRAGHPSRAKASLEELEAIHETLTRWHGEL